MVFLPFLIVSGCDNGNHKPAPIGDHAVLEQLAEAYRSVAEGYPVQPSSMRPAGKKEFVERVFSTAGYHHASTLKAMAVQGADVSNQDHRDLAELLMLPHKGLAERELAALYSSEELAAIGSIRVIFK